MLSPTKTGNSHNEEDIKEKKRVKEREEKRTMTKGRLLIDVGLVLIYQPLTRTPSRPRLTLLCPTRTRTSPALPRSVARSSLLRPTRSARSRPVARMPVPESWTRSSASTSSSAAVSTSRRLPRPRSPSRALRISTARLRLSTSRSTREP